MPCGCLRVVFVLALLSSPAQALITGSDGDEPVDNPGWPAGVAEIFNLPERIAYWVGPPFGGGQYHGEYRGDVNTLNEVLTKFAKLQSENKRVVIESGVGQSFWLRPRPGRSRLTNPHMDWQLMVWSRDNWQQLSHMPVSLNPTDLADRAKGPPTELTIYTGGHIHYDKLDIPDGVTVIDNRLEAHGFTADDGLVLEGRLVDLETGTPLAGTIRLETLQAKETGGYQYPLVETIEPDPTGHWQWSTTSEGTYRILATSEGYVPRVVSRATYKGQPRWRNIECRLAQGGEVSGRVSLASGAPLQDVAVRLSGFATPGGARYELSDSLETTTNPEGEFQLGPAPRGTASIGIHKPGYSRAGLRPTIKVPSQGIELQLAPAGQITVVVLFANTEVPDQYMIEIEPEGGSGVGKWSGSATIDDKNQFVFKNVPPGRYELWGHPNPSSQSEHTERIPIEIKGGEKLHKTITAR